MDLIVLLHPSASHSVDDGVPARVHIHDGVHNGYESECKHHTKPKDDVKYGRIVSVVAITVNLKEQQLPLKICSQKNSFYTNMFK